MKNVKIVREADKDQENFFGCFFYVIALVGLIFLVPPLLGAVAFTLRVFGNHSDFASLRYIGWDYAPLYLGLMAIAGSIILISVIKTINTSFENPISKLEIDDDKKE